MTKWIVVGTKDCPTLKISLVMKQSRDYHHLHEKWQGLAADLGVDQIDIKRLTHQIALDSIQLTGAVREVIEIWVGQNGSRATLDKLIDALKLNNLRSIAGLLNDEFQLKSSCWDIPCYYISRTLITRNILEANFIEKMEIFKDIFLFEGASLSKLNKILKNKVVENSTRMIQEVNISHNYILLDYPTHFNKICKRAIHPVHLIKLEENGDKWIHVKSNGNLSAIRNMVDKSQTHFNEMKLVNSLASEVHPVCISDSPGMGKSTLLQSIGNKLSRIDNNRKVLFTSMNELVHIFKQTDVLDDRQIALELTLEKLFCSHAGQTSSLSSRLNSNKVQIELLLDGLDEVACFNTSFAFDLLNYLSSIASIRVWVTTRPHLLEDVENTLNVFGYNIQAFTDENQISFLTDFWLSHNKNLVPDRLEQFAKTCLHVLNSKMSCKDNEIAGIPLQCLLIGEIYMEQAEEHSVATNPNETWIIHINSLVELYQKLIEKQYRKYKVTWGSNLLSEKQIHLQHIRLAVQIIFPELLNMLPVSFKEDVNLNELLKVGLLESLSKVVEPRFVHRTIAEFYIATFLVQLLNQRADKETSTCLNHFLDYVLLCRETDVVIFRSDLFIFELVSLISYFGFE